MMKYRAIIDKELFTRVTSFAVPGQTSDEGVQNVAKALAGVDEETDLLYCTGGGYDWEYKYNMYYEVWRPVLPGCTFASTAAGRKEAEEEYAGAHGDKVKLHDFGTGLGGAPKPPINEWGPSDSKDTADRFNDDKPQLSKIFEYIPEDALLEEAAVWESGAKKYGKHNWEKLWGEDTPHIVMDSLLRHVASIVNGESHDKESGLQHAAHVRCNAAMLIRYFTKVKDK